MKSSDKPAKKISVKQLSANQQNALKSTGPHDSRSSRFNAIRHGLLSKGVTELDDPQEFHQLLAEMRQVFAPVGVFEEECVSQITVLIIRIRRARLLEAESFTAHLNPPTTVAHAGKFALDTSEFGWIEVTDPGLPAQVSAEVIDQINRTILRYESANENKLFRWLNQLDRLQRARRGETVPASGALDVNLHHEYLASFGNSQEPE